MGLAFFALQLDRGNISSALTSTLTKDLGINTNQVNVGSQLLSAGIVVLEIPSNIILQKVKPLYYYKFTSQKFIKKIGRTSSMAVSPDSRLGIGSYLPSFHLKLPFLPYYATTSGSSRSRVHSRYASSIPGASSTNVGLLKVLYTTSQHGTRKAKQVSESHSSSSAKCSPTQQASSSQRAC